MTKGLSAAFSTETASVTALWSARLTGGAGQQDTSLQVGHTHLCEDLHSRIQSGDQMKKNSPDFAPVHFSIDHIPCNVHIAGTWTAVHARANCL